MELVPFKQEYSAAFLRSAGAEGWITDQAELDFLLAACPDGCLVALFAGEPSAFITALRYERSAWIGNLLVLPAFRQRGLGRGLMEQVLHWLELSGTETVWLTASAAGAHLYRTLGFMQLDQVQRWRGFGNWALQGIPPVSPAAAVSMDSLGWGDCRKLMFDALPPAASYFMDSEAFLVQTVTAAGLHIGPWGATSPKAAVALLAAALKGEGSPAELFLDAPEKNRAAGEILSASGFSVSSTTLLMYKGTLPQYRAEYVYSLASMGSYG